MVYSIISSLNEDNLFECEEVSKTDDILWLDLTEVNYNKLVQYAFNKVGIAKDGHVTSGTIVKIVAQKESKKMCINLDKGVEASRKHLRVNVNEYMRLDLGVDKPILNALITDVSFGGFGFNHNETFSVGQEVILHLKLVKSHYLTGEVVRVIAINDKDFKYAYGVRFKNTPQWVPDVLYSYIKGKLREVYN